MTMTTVLLWICILAGDSRESRQFFSDNLPKCHIFEQAGTNSEGGQIQLTCEKRDNKTPMRVTYQRICNMIVVCMYIHISWNQNKKDSKGIRGCENGQQVGVAYLNTCFCQVYLHGDLFPGVDVRIMSLLKRPLQFFELS